MFVFVSSKYGDKDVRNRAKNARHAARMCKWVVDNHPGEVPLAPHIICSQWWNDDDDREGSIDLCNAIMEKCEKLYVCGDYLPTAGMKIEIAKAVDSHVPIEYINSSMMADVDMQADLRLAPWIN